MKYLTSYHLLEIRVCEIFCNIPLFQNSLQNCRNFFYGILVHGTQVPQKIFKIFPWYSSSMNSSTMENLSTQKVVNPYIFPK